MNEDTSLNFWMNFQSFRKTSKYSIKTWFDLGFDPYLELD